MKEKISSGVVLEDEEEMFAIRVSISEVTERGYDLHSQIDPLALARRVNTPGHTVSNIEQHIAIDYTFPEPPKVNVRFEREGSTIYMTGEISACFCASCSRCADEVLQNITVPVRYIYKKFSQRLSAEDQLPSLDLGFYDGLQIDVGDVVRDLLILALPFTPVCSEDCLGLCPECGANRNREQCNCASKSKGDDRLGALRGIKLQ